MTEGQHTIRVSRGETTVEVTGSQEFVEEQFDELSDTYLVETDSFDDSEKNPSTNRSKRAKQTSLSELYTNADISYKRDAALLVGWFLEMVEGQDDFVKSEIKERAVQAKIELGANLPRDISTLIEKGYLQKVSSRDGEKAYYLTRTGESHVEDEFGINEDVN